jgi:hypothetical protein
MVMRQHWRLAMPEQNRLLIGVSGSTPIPR